MEKQEMKNQIRKGPDLARVVMPIITAMNAGNMSWSDREQCAGAILEAYRQWKSMEDERHRIEQVSCQGQMLNAAAQTKGLNSMGIGS